MWLFEWENQFGKRRIVGNSQQFREFACHNHGKKSCSSQFSSFLLAICRIPDDCIDSKRYPLFMARDVMRVLIEQLQAEGATPS
jgi:hypothetical protein